jgi:Trp operon repressor
MIIPNWEDGREGTIPWSFILGSDTNHREILERLLQDHTSMNELSRYLGVSFSGIRIKFEHEGIHIKRKRPLIERLRELGPVYNMTSKEIGANLGVPANSVTRCCRKHSIPYRKIPTGGDTRCV